MTVLIIAGVVVLLLILGIRIVPQTQEYIVERLGKYRTTWTAGIHVLIPFIDKVASRVSIKEQVLDFQPQPVITKDNVTMYIDSVVFMKVFDTSLYVYGVSNPILGVENLAATTLRNLVGAMDFDETLTGRDKINAQMEALLDEATDNWGIKVTRVEVKNIQPPEEIQEVMTKQMRAEREKRQAILEAEAHKQAIVTRAEGDKEAKVLAAEAERDARIALASGEAESIRLVYEAQAQGLEMLKNAAPSQEVIRLKSLETLERVADGNATKIFMPTEIMDCVSGLGVVGEALGIGDATPVKKKTEKMPVYQGDPCVKEGSSSITKEAAVQGFVTNTEMASEPLSVDIKWQK